jgi:hypothetical protein
MTTKIQQDSTNSQYCLPFKWKATRNLSELSGAVTKFGETKVTTVCTELLLALLSLYSQSEGYCIFIP